MCLALPARVAEVDGAEAVVDLGGVRKRISIAMTPEARVDDYVIVHVGHAIGMVDPEEAAATLALFREMGLDPQGESLATGPDAAAKPGARA